jgi:S1-C subfamily serine protease
MDLLIPATETSPQAVHEWEERFYDPTRLEVLGVRYGSPAERAGLRRGDQILEFDGQKFPNVSDLRLYIFDLPIGKEVPITVKRSGAKVQLVAETNPKRSYDSEFSL